MKSICVFKDVIEQQTIFILFISFSNVRMKLHDKVSFSFNSEAFGFGTLTKKTVKPLKPAKNDKHFISPHSNTAQSIGHLHDDVILPLRPESIRVLLSCAN